MKEKFYRFMQGRYGNDQLNLFLVVLYLALYLLFAFIFLGTAERCMLRRAENGDEPPAVLPKSALPAAYFAVFTAKPMLIEIALFAIVSLIGLL